MPNMQLTAEEAKEYSSLGTSEAPKYPYGLCLDLCDESMQKLGITAPPPVGTKFTMTAQVVVTRTGAYQMQDGETEASMGLQITDMDLASPRGDQEVANRLYGG